MKRRTSPAPSHVFAWALTTVLLTAMAPLASHGAERRVLAEHFGNIG